MNRIVVYGCSHAFGSEIIGPDVGISKENLMLSFGSLVADHFNTPVNFSARPGASNRQILFNVIEHAQSGDLCLLSWTYFGRDNWFMRYADDHLEPEIFNSFHMLESAFLADNPSQATKKRLQSTGSQFINKYMYEDVKSFSRAQNLYYQADAIRVLDFLQIYHAANAVIAQRGGTAINLHYDCNDSILHMLNGTTPYPVDKIFTKDHYNDFSIRETVLTIPDRSENLRLFLNYKNDKTFIRFYHPKTQLETSFRKWACYKLYGSDDWPNDGRHRHLGPNEHQMLANEIIKKMEI